MFCESISKIFNFSRTAEKKPTVRSDNAAVSGSIADRSNFMSYCKQMQVRLKNGKHINRKRKKYQANMLQNRFELCGSKLQKIQCKTVSVKFRFYVTDVYGLNSIDLFGKSEN